MKKKAFILATIYAFCLCTGEIQSINTASFHIIKNRNEDANLPYGYEEIELQGTLMFSINPNAIVAGSSDNAVYIGFNQSFGNVNISIYNALGGLVYSTVVNTDVQQSIFIPFSNILSGTYTVELSNANGYAEGDFDKN